MQTPCYVQNAGRESKMPVDAEAGGTPALLIFLFKVQDAVKCCWKAERARCWAGQRQRLWRGGGTGQGRPYGSCIATVAGLVVLDGLCVVDAAGRCPRGGAGRLLCDFVAAAVPMDDLGTHDGGEGGAAAGGADWLRGRGRDGRAFCVWGGTGRGRRVRRRAAGSESRRRAGGRSGDECVWTGQAGRRQRAGSLGAARAGRAACTAAGERAGRSKRRSVGRAGGRGGLWGGQRLWFIALGLQRAGPTVGVAAC